MTCMILLGCVRQEGCVLCELLWGICYTLCNPMSMAQLISGKRINRKQGENKIPFLFLFSCFSIRSIVAQNGRSPLQTFFWFKIKIKILDSECQTSGTYAKRAKQEIKKDNAAACLCFLNYLAILRPAADWAVSILPWVVSPGRSYGFLWAVRVIKKSEEGRSNSGLFASKRSKTSHGAC
jgi:hypothetical protein